MIKTEKGKLRIIYLIIVALGIILDQMTKIFCVMWLKPVGSVSLIPHVLNLTYVENTGAAFGMLKNSRWLFMIVSALAIIGITIYILTMKSKNDTFLVISLSLIASGGIGNMIDRVFLGYVVDFIDVSPLFRFAVFNGADSFVCVGAALLVLAFIIEWSREEKEKKKENSQSQKGDENDRKP